jgi:hypothetical protein
VELGAAFEAAKRRLRRIAPLTAAAVTLLFSAVPALAAGQGHHYAYGHSSACHMNRGRGHGDAGRCHSNRGVGHGRSTGASLNNRGHKVG